MTGDAQLTHIDIPGNDGDYLLALSINPAGGGIVYARSSLLREGGFVGGTYDPPSLQLSEGCIAQSA